MLITMMLLNTADAGDAEMVPKGVLAHAAKALGTCSAKEFAAKLVGSGIAMSRTYDSWEVTGCNTTFIVSWSKKDAVRFDDLQLRKRAPFDLACAAESVTYTHIDPMTRGVEGCAKRAVYVWAPQGWVVNGTSQ